MEVRGTPEKVFHATYSSPSPPVWWRDLVIYVHQRSRLKRRGRRQLWIVGFRAEIGLEPNSTRTLHWKPLVPEL